MNVLNIREVGLFRKTRIEKVTRIVEDFRIRTAPPSQLNQARSNCHAIVLGTGLTASSSHEVVVTRSSSSEVINQ